MRYKIPLREAQRYFEQRWLFDCNGTLRSSRSVPSTGMLPNEWVRYIRQFRDGIVYTVLSYQTPVAWVMRDGRVIVPPVRYSPTTDRHMRALGVRFSPAVVDTDAEVAA